MYSYIKSTWCYLSNKEELKVKIFNCPVATGTLFCVTPDWLTNGILLMDSELTVFFTRTVTAEAWLLICKIHICLCWFPQASP